MSDYEKNQSSLAAAFGYRTPGEIVEGSIPKGQKPDVGSVQGGYSEDLATRAGRGASQLAEWVGASKGVQKALDKGAYGATSALPFSEAIWQALHGDMTGAGISASLDAAGGKPGALAFNAVSSALVKTLNKHPDLLGIFVPGGMKGMEPAEIDKFRKSFEEGFSRKELWDEFQATPIPMQVNNKWITTPAREIDDSVARVKEGLESGRQYKLQDVLEHDELYNTTGDMLKNYTVEFADLPPHRRGVVRGESIKINKKFLEEGNFEQIKSTLLHEVQHGVQDKSKWPQGGTKEFLSEKTSEVFSNFEAASENLSRVMKVVRAKAGDKADYLIEALAKKEHSKESMEAAKKIGVPQFKELKKAYDQMQEAGDFYQARARLDYTRLMGEWQARMVQERVNLDALDRLFKEPVANFVDSPARIMSQGKTDDLILRRGSNIKLESKEKTLGDK